MTHRNRFWAPPNLSKLSHFLRAAPIASALVAAGLFMAPVTAGAASPPSANSTGSSWTFFPVTVNLANATASTVQGSIGADGGCSFSSSGIGVSGGAPSTQIETGIDFSTCTATFISGSPIASVSTAAAGTVTSVSTKSTPPASGVDPNAAQNNQWLDPLGIQVNAQGQTLNWTTNGSIDTSWTETTSWSYLSIDGWSPRWRYDNSTGSSPANSMSNSSFQNGVFCLGLTNYAYFGWNGSSRVNDTLFGYANGTYSWAYTDYDNGACSGLLHHGHTNS